METAYFQDLHAESFKPGEKPMQSRLIGKRAVQDGFHGLHGGREPLEVKQGFGREDPHYADLVVGRCHRSPSAVGMGSADLHGAACGLAAPHSQRVNSVTLVRSGQGDDRSPVSKTRSLIGERASPDGFGVAQAAWPVGRYGWHWDRWPERWY